MTFGLVDARHLARDLGASLDHVYAHATELGAMRLGTGPKARIRFDLDAQGTRSRPRWGGPTPDAAGKARARRQPARHGPARAPQPNHTTRSIGSKPLAARVRR